MTSALTLDVRTDPVIFLNEVGSDFAESLQIYAARLIDQLCVSHFTMNIDDDAAGDGPGTNPSRVHFHNDMRRLHGDLGSALFVMDRLIREVRLRTLARVACNQPHVARAVNSRASQEEDEMDSIEDQVEAHERDIDAVSMGSTQAFDEPDDDELSEAESERSHRDDAPGAPLLVAPVGYAETPFGDVPVVEGFVYADCIR